MLTAANRNKKWFTRYALQDNKMKFHHTYCMCGQAHICPLLASVPLLSSPIYCTNTKGLIVSDFLSSMHASSNRKQRHRRSSKGKTQKEMEMSICLFSSPSKKVFYFKCLFTPCSHCSIIMLPAFFLPFLHNENSFKGLLFHECVKLLTLNCGWCENPQKKKGDDFSATP